LCPLFEIIIVSFMNRSRGEKDALAKVLSHLKVGCSSASLSGCAKVSTMVKLFARQKSLLARYLREPLSS